VESLRNMNPGVVRERNESRERKNPRKQEKPKQEVESKEYKPFLFLLPSKKRKSKENMENKNLLIISVFNYGAIEIATNHLKSLQNQGIDNYMAYVTDEESLVELQEKGYHVTLFERPIEEGLSKGKEDFGTTHFNDFSYIRYLILGQLLKEGKTVWYLDVDTVVLSDIREYYGKILQENNNHLPDIIFQNDINMACSGCMLCFPTRVTMKILQDTYLHRNDKYNDQLFLNRIMEPYIEQNHCKIAYFQTNFFPNGLLYFHAPHAHPDYLDLQRRFRDYRDVEKGPVAFVHANWMVGIDTKIAAFKEHGLWFL